MKINKNELQGKILFKLLNHNFDNELNILLIKSMSEETILGSLARINNYYNNINNLQNNEYLESDSWQFNDNFNNNLSNNECDSCNSCDISDKWQFGDDNNG